MNVVLVLPPAEKISETKDTPKYQHVGLGYLASVLEKDGIKVTVIDAKLDRLTFDKTLKAVFELKPDIVGITAMTHEINSAVRVAGAVKEANRKIFTFLGGVHVTALPEETLSRYPCLDLGIVGEGERSFLDVLRLIQKGVSDFSGLKGIVYRENGDVRLSAPMEWIEDLDELPFPAWHQFPRASEYIIMSARGCPFSCVFCMRASGQKVRKRSAANVVEEIETVLAAKPPRRFHFHDETFTLDKERVHKLCDLIIKKGLHRKIRWSSTTRVDSIDEEVLRKMKAAGCDHIEFGVESGDQEVLERIQKRITLAQAEQAIKLAKKIGFHTEGAFILGHPHETVQSAYRTIYFASKINPDIIQVGIMVPYPGTEVARLASRGEGGYKIISRDWSDYNKQLGNALELETLSRADLERLQLIGYLKLFVFNRRLADLMRFIWRYRREAASFLRNYFRKDKKRTVSRVSASGMVNMIFCNSAECS